MLRVITKKLGAKVAADGKVERPAMTASASVDLGESLQEAIKLFGEPAVYSAYLGKATISFQSFLSSCLEKGMTPEQIQEAAKSWKLGVGGSTSAVITEQSMLSAVEKMTPDAQKAYIAKLQAMLGVKK